MIINSCPSEKGPFPDGNELMTILNKFSNRLDCVIAGFARSLFEKRCKNRAKGREIWNFNEFRMVRL